MRHFHELLDQEIERAQRFNNHIGLVMVDIDNFKQVNDTYGHPQGDLVLKEVARVLQEQSRDIDYPARYGGEEMSVILPQTDIDGAAMLAERMREAIEELRGQAPRRRGRAEDDRELRRGRAAGIGHGQALPDRRGGRGALPRQARRQEPGGARRRPHPKPAPALARLPRRWACSTTRSASTST